MGQVLFSFFLLSGQRNNLCFFQRLTYILTLFFLVIETLACFEFIKNVVRMLNSKKLHYLPQYKTDRLDRIVVVDSTQIMNYSAKHNLSRFLYCCCCCCYGNVIASDSGSFWLNACLRRKINSQPGLMYEKRKREF